MSKRSSKTAAGLEGGFDPLQTGRLTWMGLAVAGIGWALLVGEALLGAKTPRPPIVHADLLDIAKCIVASGFALAVIGALQTGFGTLNRFFGAVLTRSARRDGDASRTPIAPAPERARPAPQPIEKRPYRIFPDGSVEVETILGTRLFTTMAEARDFI